MAAGMASSAFSLRTAASAESTGPKTGMGLVIYCANLRRRSQRRTGSALDLFAPSTFLQHCGMLGAGGMQASLDAIEDAACEVLKFQASEAGLFIEAIIKPPKDQGDCARLEAEVKTAARAGALATRTVIIPGHRYEEFESLEQFRTAEQRGRQMIERAVPIVEKHGLLLAIENHKNQCNDHRLRPVRMTYASGVQVDYVLGPDRIPIYGERGMNSYEFSITRDC